MDVTTLPAHLDYLNDAGHLLRISAPESSAYLMSRRNELLFHHNLEQTDVQRQHVCGSCGHIMIPGQDSTLKLEVERAARKSRHGIKAKSSDNMSKTQDHGTIKVLKCGHCNETTKIALPRPPPITRRKTRELPVKASRATHISEGDRMTANASSKKRAKSRKAGLQALLSQNKASSSQSGRTLSLADFMKR